jgi:fatty acid desaturase
VFHWEHHRHTQDLARDPELSFPKPASVGAYLFVLMGIPNFVRGTGDLLRLAAGLADGPWVSPAERRPLIIEARAYLAAYALVTAGSVIAGTPVVLLVWLLPYFVGQAFLRPYLFAEHTGCAFTRDCLDNTRTTLTLVFVRLFAWNMPYHAEHHAFPAVPFHALPRLHDQVRGKIANLELGYVAATITVNRCLFGTRRTASEGGAE